MKLTSRHDKGRAAGAPHAPGQEDALFSLTRQVPRCRERQSRPQFTGYSQGLTLGQAPAARGYISLVMVRNNKIITHR